MLKTGLVGVITVRVQSRHSCMMILLAMVMFLHPVNITDRACEDGGAGALVDEDGVQPGGEVDVGQS